MSNVRPWFRFARPKSQGSSDPPQPQPTPRPTVVVQPQTRQPISPQERSPSRHMSPPTPPKAVSPSPKEVQEALPPPKPNSPPHSSRSIKSESSPGKAARLLSPYSRSHSDHQTTQKNILTAEKTSQLHDPKHHHNHDNNKSQNKNPQSNSTKKVHHKTPSSEYENLMGARVITIAGENKGATMEILQSAPGGGSGTHSSRVLKGEGEKGRRLRGEERDGKEQTTKNHNNGNHPMKAFINSNVQMINNSIVYNSTATHHDPGVHLKLLRKHGSGNGFHVGKIKTSPVTRKEN